MSSDIVIVGAGCMGASTAYHLVQRDPSLQVTVYDRDLSLARASTLLSDGNVRIQFNLEENVLISRYAMEVLERFGDEMAVGDFRPDVGMKKQGNLFFVDEDSQEAARQGLELQRSLGCNVEWLDMHAVTERWPVLASDRFVGGTFGSDDGAVDPNAVTSGYRRAAEARGARFVQAEVASLTTSGERVGGVVLADGTVHSASTVVVCGGAWSTSLLATAGVEIPVEPVMRTVYVVRSDVAGGQMLPSFFLPSGLYVISENPDTFFIAWSLPDDPVGFDFTPADRTRFYEIIWPALVEAIPAFDRLEVVRSWAGLYEQNTLDANGIIGEWPGITGLYQATGFSGHGFQQCHAVGRYLAESIIGQEPFLDLSRLGPERIVENRPVFEHAGRII
ncbi:MAG: FAD-binding oxidoreductase [Actinomycetes bacterium]|jgi:FAD-dependent oxidoreductase domain-containing protein 1|nr:FAD-binding oxidoreductase [Acidimicrobiia bacterium]